MSTTTDYQEKSRFPVPHKGGTRRCVVVDNLTCINPAWLTCPKEPEESVSPPDGLSAEVIPIFPQREESFAVLRLLAPVDWASIQTLAGLTQLSHETVTDVLQELEQEGKVRMGTRRIEPDTRAVAWLVDPTAAVKSRS